MAMTANQIFTLGLAAVVVVLVVLLLALRTKTPATAELSIHKAFSLKVSLSPDEKEKATNDAAVAAKARGQSVEAATEAVRSKLSTVQQVRLKRVLWVDDHPDNNVYESLALMRLGFIITTVTSNKAARIYLAEAYFDLIITDLGRDGTDDDGQRLIREQQTASRKIPLVVYTVKADERQRELIAAGASAVEDQPGQLIATVLTIAS
ncbi:MAG: response regulator [Mycobacterium sp.]